MLWKRYKCFKRLSASLHVKDEPPEEEEASGSFQTPFGITACERRRDATSRVADAPFQTPFGITACESLRLPRPTRTCGSFKRLSASLHVKEYRDLVGLRLDAFQTPFGITACESAYGRLVTTQP